MTRTAGRHRQAIDEDLADAELLAAVRTGDTDAFEVLYGRHAQAARRLARVMVRDPGDADDLVAEAFAKVLAALRLGKGPEVAFRAYLLTSVRNACYDRARRDRRIELTEDIGRYERPGGGLAPGMAEPAGDPALARLERSYAARAFAKLPERWQVVLWHTEVEGEKPATIAPMLGLSPNAVAALAYRARERLRQIYLQEHLSVAGNPSCHWTVARLGAHVRRALPRRDRSKVDAHLADCADCQVLWAELAEVNSGLRGVLAPAVLGVAATPYLAAVPGTAWWAGAVQAVRHAWSALIAWIRGRLRQYGSANVAAGAGLAAAALVGVLLFAMAAVLGPKPDRGEPPPPAAGGPDRPVPVPEPAPSTGPEPSSGPPATASPDGTGPPPPLDVPEVPEVPAALPPLDPVNTDLPDGPLAVGPDLSTTSLAAGDQGELAIAVRLPESAPVESAAAPTGAAPARPTVTASPSAEEVPAGRVTEATGTTAEAAGADPTGTTPGPTGTASRPGDAAREAPTRPPSSQPPTEPPTEQGRAGQVELAVAWPAGITLAGPDAGEGWRCAAREAGAVCRRAGWEPGSSSTARLPVTVDEALGGFAPVTVTVTVGGRRGEAGFRVPVAPVGLEVAYADTGRYRLAMAGNTWLSCSPRPECLRGDQVDNNAVPVRPYLPGAGEPDLPPGLSRPLAASGAELAIPAGAEVVWAALHWATTAAGGPEQVLLHGSGGGWHQVTPDAVRPGADRPLWQAYADVTDLIRAGGAWWVAAAGGTLPESGNRATAGWSLTVVYAERDAPRREIAVFAGPVGLSASRQLAASAAAAGREVEVGLVLWEGDRAITGDALLLDDQPLGEAANVAASRAAGALECGDAAVGRCDWHTFGVDVAQYRATPGGEGDVTLHTPADQLEVGVVSLAVAASR